ncbi:hypothetical protein [Pararhodospirillum photometricum]|uniref:hypothetical protein n=1 Tax=Pararhodospirillum photometricum TaxID=1084 RepID=UPI0012FEC92A|nr:hypothetical protein [Pararhodospirillum photometricum]
MGNWKVFWGVAGSLSAAYLGFNMYTVGQAFTFAPFCEGTGRQFDDHALAQKDLEVWTNPAKEGAATLEKIETFNVYDRLCVKNGWSLLGEGYSQKVVGWVETRAITPMTEADLDEWLARKKKEMFEKDFGRETDRMGDCMNFIRLNASIPNSVSYKGYKSSQIGEELTMQMGFSAKNSFGVEMEYVAKCSWRSGSKTMGGEISLNR